MKKYSTLYIDVDGTLLDFIAAESHAAEQLFKDYGLPHDGKAVKLYSGINDRYWKMFEEGRITKPELVVLRFEELLKVFGEKRDAKQMNRDYFELLSHCHFLIDGATETLTYLKKSGYLMYAATNGVVKTQYKRIRESGIEPFFDGIFVSEVIGFQKPSPEYFDYIIEHTPEKDRSKILVIGDSMTSDIKGGTDSGLDTCWYDAFGEKKTSEPTYTVKNIRELTCIL